MSKTWLVADARGSVVARTDGTGAATTVNTYDPYGLPASGNGGRFQYTGQIWLAEAGLHHYKARAYNPALGRFMQTDPLGYADGMNMYAYVGGDPVNNRDPSGLHGDDNLAYPHKGMSLSSAPVTVSYGGFGTVAGGIGGASGNVPMGQIGPKKSGSAPSPTHGSTIGSSSAEWVAPDRIVITGTRALAWEAWPSGFVSVWAPGGGASAGQPICPYGGDQGCQIENAREIAIAQLKAYIGNADVSVGADEDGAFALYNKDSRQIEYFYGEQAGRATNTYFDYYVPSQDHYVILAFAHSHPKDRAGRRVDRLNESIRGNVKDNNIVRNFAPLVLKTPSGKIKVCRKANSCK